MTPHDRSDSAPYGARCSARSDRRATRRERIMSAMKRYAEEVSVALGREGALDENTLAIAQVALRAATADDRVRLVARVVAWCNHERLTDREFDARG